MAKCSKCGKRAPKGCICKDCYKARMDALHARAQAIVATGKCPQCGEPLRRNLALAGWYQCSQFGADGFRADSSRACCMFQCFTGE